MQNETLPPAHRMRPATIADRDELASLHVEVWRTTYRDIAPAEAYEALDESRRRPHWDDLLARPDGLTLVVENDLGLVAFGHASTGRNPVMEGAGEVVHLYVRQTNAGSGLGRSLFISLARFLQAQGHRTMRLAVVHGNVQAVQFYEHLGGRCVGEFMDGVLWRSDNLIYEWPLDGDTSTWS